MRYLIFIFILFSGSVHAASSRGQLSSALLNIERGDYVNGSKQLYYLSRLAAFKNKRVQIKYTLGIAFMEMKLYHMASLQFLYVVKRNNRMYRTKALEKLIYLMNYLGDDNLFYYVTNSIQVKNFPASQRGIFYFYQGLSYFKKGKFNTSRVRFFKIRAGTKFYNKARYYIALSYAEQNKPYQAAKIFRNLSLSRKQITDTNRVAALMGWARSLYQAKKFKQAIKVYRSIPRDTKFWHDVLLESSWAYLRSAKFRSSLSNFQTLHSSFYNEYYQPESLILRSYVYLYICKYYEMEKVLDLFNAIYLPTLKKVKRQLQLGKAYTSYFNSFLASQKASSRAALPPVVVNRLKKNTEFENHLSYLKKLEKERAQIQALPRHWIKGRIGRNANHITRSRISSIKKQAGKLTRKILLGIKKDLERISLSEQYLRYDMLRGKREAVKKRIARRYVDVVQIDEKMSRDYYIKNGYEYWPFKNENWLDELGNYHYLGLHNCQ